MKFTKMHGASNDYIYINGFVENIGYPRQLAPLLSDRHKGIGSDGLVLILPSDQADFRMRMFNADGSEAEMCGNASRCIGKFVYDKGLTKKTELSLETLAGVKSLSLSLGINKQVERVTVDMGEPTLSADKIPSTIPKEFIINELVDFGNGIAYHINAVSMGNPHVVIFTKGVDSLNLNELGPVIENAAIFPNRTNVEFVEILSESRLQIRVWERGSGETMACGTGACASLVAAVLNGHTRRKVDVELTGGVLVVEWDEQNSHVYLTGGATTVFEGEIII